MKKESIEKLKELMVSTYKKMGDKKALTTRVIGGKSYTGNEIAKEIEDETEIGLKMMDNIIQLSVDLVSRDKINIDDRLYFTNKCMHEPIENGHYYSCSKCGEVL